MHDQDNLGDFSSTQRLNSNFLEGELGLSGNTQRIKSGSPKQRFANSQQNTDISQALPSEADAAEQNLEYVMSSVGFDNKSALDHNTKTTHTGGTRDQNSQILQELKRDVSSLQRADNMSPSENRHGLA